MKHDDVNFYFWAEDDRKAYIGQMNEIGELDEKRVYSILEYTATDGKIYKTKFYNLDAIVSVGYRVNSINATRFRQ